MIEILSPAKVARARVTGALVAEIKASFAKKTPLLVMFFSWLVGKLERRLRSSDH